MADESDYWFASWALRNNKFDHRSASYRMARYLVTRSDTTGLGHKIHTTGLDDHDLNVMSTYDVYALLRKAEPGAWREYSESLESMEEAQARLDNARGKRY